MSAKQAINDKLQGSVATYIRCDGVLNNQIKKGLLLSLWVTKNKIGEYLAKLQTRAWLFRALSPYFSSVLAKRTSARYNHILACSCRIFTDFKISKKLLKSAKNWQNYGHESVAPFFNPPCIVTDVAWSVFVCWTQCVGQAPKCLSLHRVRTRVICL